MNKLGRQPLTVLMQSESSAFGWALTPGRPSPTVIALRILIALCAALPVCFIGFASFTTGGMKPSILARVSPRSDATTTPPANPDGPAAVSDSDPNRRDPKAVTDNAQPVDQTLAPAVFSTPVSATPVDAKATANDSSSAESAPRAAGRIKLEKFRRRAERRRARLEELYQ